jgi:hypothetical protein
MRADPASHGLGSIKLPGGDGVPESAAPFHLVSMSCYGWISEAIALATNSAGSTKICWAQNEKMKK